MDILPEFEQWERVKTGRENEYEWQRGKYTVACVQIESKWIVTGLEPMPCEDGEIIIDDKHQRDGIYNIEEVPDAIKAIIHSINKEL